MREAFTMRFRPEVAEFVQAQAKAHNRSVTNFVETLQDGAGVLGRAPKPLRTRVNAIATELAKRRPETLSRTGPLWKPA